MNKTVKNIGVVLLFVLAVFSFLYVNYLSGNIEQEGNFLLKAELTEVEISKFLLESLKRVVFSGF